MGKLNWWEFADWTSGYKDGVPPQEADGESTFLTLQYMEALRDAADLEAKFGNPERVVEYRSRFRKASDALNRLSWDKQYGLFADTPGKSSYSQEPNILAVWLDVAPRPQQGAILRRLLGSQTDRTTTIDGKQVPPMSQITYYFRFCLSRALEHAGLGDMYLDELVPWRDMLKLGLSTWAEKPEPTRSDSHAWSASPNYDLLTIVAGIRPGAPGFTECPHRTSSSEPNSFGGYDGSCGRQYSRHVPPCSKVMAGNDQLTEKINRRTRVVWTHIYTARRGRDTSFAGEVIIGRLSKGQIEL